MSQKTRGLCPFCEEQVQAIVLEENYLRRDRCMCPECGEDIYVCRSPGCYNYAKGGEYYDDELCPACTKGVADFVKGSAETIGGAAVIAVAGTLAAFFKRKD